MLFVVRECIVTWEHEKFIVLVRMVQLFDMAEHSARTLLVILLLFDKVKYLFGLTKIFQNILINLCFCFQVNRTVFTNMAKTLINEGNWTFSFHYTSNRRYHRTYSIPAMVKISSNNKLVAVQFVNSTKSSICSWIMFL